MSGFFYFITMANKQTAVSFIDKEIIKHSIIYKLCFEDQMEVRRILKRAKKIEKQQIEEAYRFPNTMLNQTSEDYYTKNYGSF